MIGLPIRYRRIIVAVLTFPDGFDGRGGSNLGGELAILVFVGS